MRENYKQKILILLFFLGIAVIVQIISYPIGTYDLSGDLWNTGDVMSAIIDKTHFQKDVYLSDIGTSKINTEMYFHIPLFMIFNNYEWYVAFTSFSLYFLGMILLFILFNTIIDDISISAIASIIFSSSSIWFFPLGDIFALIPIYGAVGKSISYCFLLLILIIYVRFIEFRYRDEIVVIMCTLLVWLHPLTFLGPGLALIGYVLFESLFKKMWLKVIKLIFISLALVLPYILIYSNLTIWSFSNISTVDLQELKNIIKLDKIMVWNPLSVFNSLKCYLFGTNGYCLLALTLLLLPFKGTKRHLVRFFLISSFSFIPLSLFLKLIGFYVLHQEVHFFMLDRNLKWVYFYIFVLFIALYNNFKGLIADSGSQRLIRAKCIYTFVLLLIFFPQIKVTISSTFGTKLFYKTAKMAHWFLPTLLGSVKEKFGLDIRDINKDSDQAADYIREKLPSNIGMIGPTWIPYKTHKSLVFHENYIYHSAGNNKMSDYRRLLEIRAILESFTTDIELEIILRKLRGFNIDYLLFEKFKMDPNVSYVRYIPNQQTLFIKDRFRKYIEFENDNFLLIRSY